MEKEKTIKAILKSLKSGKMGVDAAFNRLKDLPYADLGFAKFDLHRELRKGFPEVVFCQGKTLRQLETLVRKLKGKVSPLVLTRADRKMFDRVKKAAPRAKYYETARIIVIGNHIPPEKHSGLVLVITAGTADLPVAEEAAVTAEIMGNSVRRMYDVGVAGIHRVLDKRELLLEARVLVVVAGMDGVLPSIIAGLVDRPVIAVPTSVGYGANFKGIAPLLTMLNACSPGIAVVNIDNGFGAGYMAATINKMAFVTTDGHR
jgi:NCAIR mutase (PurE)-related protein